MESRQNPNQAFKCRNDDKYPYGSPRPRPQRVIMIRCDATNCGHRMLISRDVWIGQEEIECPICGQTDYWSTM